MSNAFIDVMMERVSFPRLCEPAPSPALLEKVYQIALRTPDHMKLKPWRFLVIEGKARQNLGKIFCEAALNDDPELNQAGREKYNNMPLRAPMIIIGVCKGLSHPKVPVAEQVLSTGSALSYMLLALQVSGFGGVWRTGPLATHPIVMNGLGLSLEESIVGFLYLGTPKGEAKKLSLVDSSEYFQRWV